LASLDDIATIKDMALRRESTGDVGTGAVSSSRARSDSTCIASSTFLDRSANSSYVIASIHQAGVISTRFVDHLTAARISGVLDVLLAWGIGRTLDLGINTSSCYRDIAAGELLASVSCNSSLALGIQCGGNIAVSGHFGRIAGLSNTNIRLCSTSSSSANSIASRTSN